VGIIRNQAVKVKGFLDMIYKIYKILVESSAVGRSGGRSRWKVSSRCEHLQKPSLRPLWHWHATLKGRPQVVSKHMVNSEAGDLHDLKGKSRRAGTGICKRPPCFRCGIAYHVAGPTLGGCVCTAYGLGVIDKIGRAWAGIFRNPPCVGCGIGMPH